MITRRRLLVISAAALALPARSDPLRWTGRAMGAEAQLTFHAPAPLAKQAIAAVQQEITKGEALFSLYNPDSALSELNRHGTLSNPDPDFVAVLRIANTVHHATGGAFDPTIQPLWQALAQGTDTAPARDLIGWGRVQIAQDHIHVGTGQKLSLNGIAQGFVSDRVATRLKSLGLTHVLVNIGEFATIGGPWNLGISDPQHGLFASQTLTDRAIATTSPQATLLRGNSHILNPANRTAPQWSTISVVADSAALADASSTAFALMTKTEIRAAKTRLPSVLRVHLLGEDGRTLQL